MIEYHRSTIDVPLTDPSLPAPEFAMKPAAPTDDGLIFDIGMDQCQDTDFYLAKGFRVVAVDANPEVCEQARRRYPQAIADGQLTVVNAAISTGREPLRFYVCRTLSALSTADPALRDRETRNGYEFDEIIVPGLRPADLLETYGAPYFAKIDIEGFDVVCLEGFRDAKARPEYVSSEVDFRALARQIAALEAMGYDRFAMVPQAAAPQMRPPRPAREGRDIDYTFAHHASGLFGRELPEPWLDAGAVRARAWAQWRRYKAAAVLGKLAKIRPLKPLLMRWRAQLPHVFDWFDIHATRADG